MDEVTDRAVGLRHLGGVALGRHDVLHDVSAVAEVVEADHRQETQEEPEEEGRQPTGISLVGLHNLVRGATACKYNDITNYFGVNSKIIVVNYVWYTQKEEPKTSVWTLLFDVMKRGLVGLQSST